MSVADAAVDTTVPKTGDVLTHPVHGPVRIVSTCTRTVRGTERSYVDLEVIGDEMRISVPADGKDVIGLRPILGNEEIDGLIAQLSEPIEVPEKKASWAHRIKSLQMQLQTGRLTDRVEVIRSIMRDSGGTPSSLAERNLLKQAIDPLASEIAIARAVSRDEASELLQTTAENALVDTAA
ncbi:CarD family transcriptional regulator [Brachybacterium aquaticum]|uniref:CarD family transcriptional regulator n=1 Tax=Brachybacterium aquaticum TaxID=1432564 RepID=A0A841AEX5_9MICO|nr:CarD family transcriptional regulator [Brachybacterium aquaticum]MBB5832141.1 CarD family transcriptional regulator [Brachybacterium aquaticum]